VRKQHYLCKRCEMPTVLGQSPEVIQETVSIAMSVPRTGRDRLPSSRKFNLAVDHIENIERSGLNSPRKL
jgi:hypothetical protein